MQELLIGSVVLSFLHALLPNHWIPVLAVSNAKKWSIRETLTATFGAAMAHAISTVLIGWGVAFLGYKMADSMSAILSWIGPSLLIGMGVFFLYQHHHHAHFHLNVQKLSNKTSTPAIMLAIFVAMFFSPCLEISGFFVLAGAHDWGLVITISLIYGICTTIGMCLWVWWMYPKVLKLDWHALEHKSGLISGWTLIVTGVISLLL